MNNPRSAQSKPPEPRAVPLRTPDPSNEKPAGFAHETSIEATAELATAGRDRLSAENFAVSFAQLVVDAREERDQEQLVERLTSAGFDDELRDHLVLSHANQVAMRSGRHYDPDEPAWIRSTFEGDEEAPDEVDVEVGGVVRGFDHRSLATMRVRAVWDDDRWRAADMGGPSIFQLDEPEPRKALVRRLGGQWRSLSALRG